MKKVLEKRKELSKDFFDKSAKNYDCLVQIYEDEKIRFYSLLSLIDKNLNIIDFGCGTGLFLPFLAQINSNIIAIDTSSAMLAEAKEKMKNYKNINFINCDYREIPVQTEWADACFINMVLHHIDKPKDLIMIIKKYLKKNGKLIITDFYKHDDEKMRENYGDLWLGFEIDNIKKWLFENTFENITIQNHFLQYKKVFIISTIKIS